MRLIDADALKAYIDAQKGRPFIGCTIGEALKIMTDEQPTIEPEQRWISCSERLPEEPYGCLVTVWDTNPITMDEFENILPYFVGWDGEQWNDGDGEQCPFEVIAWMPLPEPWRGNNE